VRRTCREAFLGMSVEQYQFRPDVFTALVDAVALIRNSKRDVVTLFRGAGLQHPQLAEYERLIAVDRESLRKTEMAHTLLKIANEIPTDEGLKIRREILKAVVDFNNFEACYNDKVLAAKGAVAKVRELVHEKDAFTRMEIERDRERSARIAKEHSKVEEARRKAEAREDIKRRLFALFTLADEYERGRLFESVLNDWFKHEGISVRESFRLTGDVDNRTFEQIDGAVDVDGHLYIVEVKWWKKALGPKDVSEHVMREYNRGEARGLFIVNPDYTDAAVHEVSRALPQRVFVFATTEELYHVMNDAEPLSKWIRDKAHAALTERTPLRRYPPRGG
jgi:restriction system protein